MPKPERSVKEESQELKDAFDDFTKRMLSELNDKVALGYKRWDDPTMHNYMKEQISNHLAGDDWIAVANLAMFLDNLEI